MNNVKVTRIEFLCGLLPRMECGYAPFCSTPDVCPDDLPFEVNKDILEAFKKGLDVVPVKVTINVSMPKENTENLADEVMSAARRALKSVEYINGTDRGAVNPDSQGVKKPYMFAVKADPCRIIYAITCGHSCSVKVIGFLTRAN